MSDTHTPPTPSINNSENNSESLIPNGHKANVWYALALIVLVVDQLSKQFFLTTLKVEGNSIPVFEPFFNWTLAYNHGAAFSFLADQGGWQKFFFSGLALVVSGFLVWYLRRVPRQASLLSLALACILGGAIGNLIDRVRYGYVIDFIHVHYADVWHYPVFNIADCAIILGVVFMVYDIMFLENKRHVTNTTATNTNVT